MIDSSWELVKCCEAASLGIFSSISWMPITTQYRRIVIETNFEILVSILAKKPGCQWVLTCYHMTLHMHLLDDYEERRVAPIRLSDIHELVVRLPNNDVWHS